MSNSQDQLFRLGFDRNQKQIDRTKLTATGKIPAWLQGSFIRNGPGLFYVGEQRFKHWFDGLAMLHKFDFDGGHIYYQNKFLECEAARQALQQDRLTYAEFATDPCWGLFGRMRSLFKHGPTDSAKVNLAKIGENYFALGETTMQIQFDLSTLESLGAYNYRQPKFGTSSTAHPHQEGSDSYNLITKYGPINRYQITKMDSQASKVASISSRSPSYMHSFGMSDRYFVIIESPFTVQSIKLLLANRPFIENFSWNKQRGSRIFVIDRNSHNVVFSKEVDPFFFFHFVNTFDTESGLSFDLVTYPDAEIIQSYYLDHIHDPTTLIPGGTLQRFSLNFDRQEVTSRILSDAQIELPHMDYQHYNKRGDYRFVYAMSLSDRTSNFYDEIVKIDIHEGRTDHWRQDGCYPGEPVFVRSPTAAHEDDGVILTLVLDTDRSCSFLLVLDASSFQELGRVEAPEPILVGFHGQYFEKQMI